MLETAHKLLLASLGTLELTQEKFQALMADLIKRGELTEQQARALADEWKRRLAARRQELQQEVREGVQRTLRGLNVPSRQELEALAKRVEALERNTRPAAQGLPQADMDVEC